MCHRGPLTWGLLSIDMTDHGDEEEDDESTNETTKMMPPLPPGSWFKRTDVLREVSETLT